MSTPNDASRKSPRTFQCRDQLWETFEQMARELECSVDYLINEAMKQYARARSYGAQAGGAQAGGVHTGPLSGQRTPVPGGREGSEATRNPLPSTAPAVPMARGGSGPPSGIGGRLPPPPPPPPPPGGRLPPAPGGVRSAGPPPMPASRAPTGGPPPLPRASASMAAPPVPVPVQPAYIGGLTAIYQGERTPVNKEKFIIGRGRQTSDLMIKDPNVSRQHAMVEYQNGVFYMVDLGSTNGVEWNGQRVSRKAITEGDVFKICDHEVVFTYR